MNASIADQTALPPTAHASPQALAKASAAAILAAGAALVLFVLPAEAGIDPTGVGNKLGLTGMGVATAGIAPDAALAATGEGWALPTPTRASIEATSAWRDDVETFELAPHSGIEIKAHMKKGDSYIFDWESTGPVKVDMHGEPPNATDDEFTSYWVEKQATSQAGTFVAPIEGKHGWYWRNKGDAPVTITLKVSGFYKDLFRP